MWTLQAGWSLSTSAHNRISIEASLWLKWVKCSNLPRQCEIRAHHWICLFQHLTALLVEVVNSRSSQNWLPSPPVDICKQTSACFFILEVLDASAVFTCLPGLHVILDDHYPLMQIQMDFLWCAANKLWSQPLETATCGSLLGDLSSDWLLFVTSKSMSWG